MLLPEVNQEIQLYTPHQFQYQIAIHPARFKVVACGRRFGKTTLAINELLYFGLLHQGSTLWYIAPTYRQAKSIAWRMLIKSWYSLPEDLRGNKNESELWVEVNDSRIELKGADNEDSLRGVGLNGIVIDEVASIKNWDYLWEEVIRPALTDKEGWGIFISTPNGFNHFYDLYNREVKDKNYKSFHFTSYDNPYLAPQEIETAKLELTEDAFAQEYLADFRKASGLIYADFNRKIHVIEPKYLPEEWQYYRMMDFGASNPTVCLWAVVDNYDNVYIFDEYYKSQLGTKFHAEIIKRKTRNDIIATYGDPSGEQTMLDYAQEELYIVPATKTYTNSQNWVKSGIIKVQELIKLNPQTGRPRLYIFNTCVNTIREFEGYHWIDNASKEMPDKVDDHCMDALRYFIVSFPGFKQSDDSDEYSILPNQFTGYSTGYEM